MPRRRHFSMIRDFSVADLLTLANGFAGMGAVLATLQYMDTRDRRILWIAFALPLVGRRRVLRRLGSPRFSID